MEQSHEPYTAEPEHARAGFDSWGTDDRHPDAAPAAGPARDMNAASVAEHLTALLASADGTAKRIIQEAEARARDQMAEIDRRAKRVEAEAARLAAWSRQTEKLIQSMWSAFTDFRKDMESVPQRINEMLAPLASHAQVVVRQIDNLTKALGSQASGGDLPAVSTPVASSGAFPNPMPFEAGLNGPGGTSEVTSWDEFASGSS